MSSDGSEDGLAVRPSPGHSPGIGASAMSSPSPSPNPSTKPTLGLSVVRPEILFGTGSEGSGAGTEEETPPTSTNNQQQSLFSLSNLSNLLAKKPEVC